MKPEIIGISSILSVLTIIVISYPYLQGRVNKLVVSLTVSFARTYGTEVPKALITRYVEDVKKGVIARVNEMVISDRSGVSHFLRMLEKYAKGEFTAVMSAIYTFMKKRQTKTSNNSKTASPTESKYITPDTGEVYYESE